MTATPPAAPLRHDPDVLVIGGVAGLFRAYHLHRSGIEDPFQTAWLQARGALSVIDGSPCPGAAGPVPGMRADACAAAGDLPGPAGG